MGSSAAPGRWRTLGWLSGALMLAMTTWFSTAAVLPELRQRWDLTTNQSSLLIVVLQVGFVAGAVGSAVVGLADRVPPRYLIASSAMLAAVTNAAIVLADDYQAGLVLRILTGVFLAGVYPPALKLTATWFREGRGLAMGAMVGALTLGSAAPHLVNGLGGLEWALVMYSTSAMTVVGGVVIGVMGQLGPYPFPVVRFDPAQARRALAQRDVQLATLAYLGHMWELYAMWAWISLFLLESLDASPQRSSLLAFAVISVGAIGAVAAGVAGDAWGKARSATVAMAISGAAALVVGWAGLPGWLTVLVALVWGVSVVADSAQLSAIVSERADQRYVGTALTAQLAVGFLLTAATIWLVPLVRDAAGWGAAFALLAPGPLLGAWALRHLSLAEVSSEPA